MVVGNFWSEAEGEVLPVAHLVLVHRGNGFNDLNHVQKTSSVSNRDVEWPLNYIRLHSDVQTYLSRHCRLTHEDLTVGSKLWRVVVHIFDSDVDTNFGVLMMAACTQTRKPR